MSKESVLQIYTAWAANCSFSNLQAVIDSDYNSYSIDTWFDTQVLLHYKRGELQDGK